MSKAVLVLFILHPSALIPFSVMAENLQKLKWRGQFFRYVPLFLWIGLVLFLSTGQASMSNTSRFVRPLLEFLFPNSPEEILIVYHGYIRKLAHVTEYAILAFWASRAFSSSNLIFLRRFWFLFAFVLVSLVASIDETNQSYIASRTGSLDDVLLDIAGGTAMLLVFYSITKYRTRHII
ncbi:MAG: VanZ family protein [Pyrinomonadaceae bacterium]|nr:VanZ family protein [Pyrinomonadaceae bacterium]